MRTTITKRLALIATIPATLLGLVMVAAPASAAVVSAAPASATLASATPASAAVVSATPASAAVVSEAKLQGDIAYLTNKQRQLNGCKAVHVDARLTNAARVQSTYMARSGSFSHIGSGGSTFVARVKAAHYPQPAGENIAYGFRSGVDVVKAWMASPPHRANILNCKAKTVGVGAVYAKSGSLYYTQEFGY